MFALALDRALRRVDLAATEVLAQPLLLNEACVGLVERGVVLHVQALMREFVKHRADQHRIAPAHHRVQHRVVEPAER